MAVVRASSSPPTNIPATRRVKPLLGHARSPKLHFGVRQISSSLTASRQLILNRIRWLILVLGPLPIAGSSWAVSAWFKSAPPTAVARNSVVPDPLRELRVAAVTEAHAPPGATREALARACDQSAAMLEKELGIGCRVIAQSPFVLGGDLAREELEAWHADTIVPAVRAMQLRYFQTPPDRPVTVLLFRGEQSYNRYCRTLFGDSDISVYGYYKPNVRTLVLNVGTGSGTLLHELTHALMDFDFPEAPDWLNEGLASLHEQCRFRTGAGGPWIEGLVNWRLKGLQEVIRQGRLRSVGELVADANFRGPLVGTNYAQARYFCLYMQHKGVLEEFFRTFRGACKSDPRGINSIAKVFGGATWPQLDHDFQQWVAALSESR